MRTALLAIAIGVVTSSMFVGLATAQKVAPSPPGAVTPKPPKKWTVMVTLTEQVSGQCGGAAYRPELDDIVPFTGATYLVRRGKTNAPGKVIAQATSDSAGHLYFNLPKGTYCLITPDKKDVSNKAKPDDLLGPKAVAAPNPARATVTDELSNEDKKYCDLVVVAPTKTATLNHYRSTCPPLPPGASPPP